MVFALRKILQEELDSAGVHGKSAPSIDASQRHGRAASKGRVLSPHFCHAVEMVRTGRRASALASLLEAGGLTADPVKRRPPRLEDLAPSIAREVLSLYKDLGGALNHPVLRPGAWDLSMGGVLIELDEELHFNRYRKMTLDRSWAASLPWTRSYVEACDTGEAKCLRAATWGRRWSNQSSAHMFGAGAPPGQLTDGGAPRWKQRALYDAVKDAAVYERDLRVARLSVYDEVSGSSLGRALEGRHSVDIEELRQLLLDRTT
jgi:hypothetical protein